MFFSRLALIASVALAGTFVLASPVAEPDSAVEERSAEIVKREYSYGNPHQVTDQGNRFKLNFEDTGSHPNACPGHYICYVPRPGGKQHGDVSLGNPDDFVDEGNRWRLNYGSTKGHPNACDGHYICYISK